MPPGTSPSSWARSLRRDTSTLPPPETCAALADADLLEQALLGLVANALKHTPAGGRVDILVTRPREGPRIVVADTGPGIDKQTI